MVRRCRHDGWRYGKDQQPETAGGERRCNFEGAVPAIKYSEMEREEKIENDARRSIMHDRFMDNTRIYLRYLHNNGVEIPDIKQMEDDRKLFGHFACYFIFRIECEQA